MDPREIAYEFLSACRLEGVFRCQSKTCGHIFFRDITADGFCDRCSARVAPSEECIAGSCASAHFVCQNCKNEWDRSRISLEKECNRCNRTCKMISHHDSMVQGVVWAACETCHAQSFEMLGAIGKPVTCRVCRNTSTASTHVCSTHKLRAIEDIRRAGIPIDVITMLTHSRPIVATSGRTRNPPQLRVRPVIPTNRFDLLPIEVAGD